MRERTIGSRQSRLGRWWKVTGVQIIGIAYRSREGVYTMFALRYRMTPCLQTSREIASVNRPLLFFPGLYISRGLTFKLDNPRLPHGEISMLRTIFRLMFHKHFCLFLHVRTVQPRGYCIFYHGCENNSITHVCKSIHNTDPAQQNGLVLHDR